MRKATIDFKVGRLVNGSENWSKIHWFFVKMSDILLDNWNRSLNRPITTSIRGQNILLINWDLTQILNANRQRDRSIMVNVFVIFVVFHSCINYFSVFQNPHFGISSWTAQLIFYVRPIWTGIVSSLKYVFPVGSFSTRFGMHTFRRYLMEKAVKGFDNENFLLNRLHRFRSFGSVRCPHKIEIGRMLA